MILPTLVVRRIQSGELDVYAALDKFVSQLAGRGLMPKQFTHLTYGTIKPLMHKTHRK